MDSLSKLAMILERIEDNGLDHDMMITFQWEAITGWAKDVLKLNENIRETSLNSNHKVERMEKAINKIKPI